MDKKRRGKVLSDKGFSETASFEKRGGASLALLLDTSIREYPYGGHVPRFFRGEEACGLLKRTLHGMWLGKIVEW